MSHNSRVISASPAQVWDVLADGWLYPLWVVGASRLRDVEPAWPAEGSRLHHSVGAWPLLIDDDTRVMASVPLERLVLRARGWPAGEASVTITLEPDDAGTRVDIREDAVSGPGRLVPKPLRAVGIGWRNVETLRRLAYVVEGRA